MASIHQLFEEYKERVADIHLYQRAAYRLMREELRELTRGAEVDSGVRANEVVSTDRFLFYDATHAKAQLFGRRERTTSQLITEVQLHKNKQYAWLLVDVYELFEDFIEDGFCIACVTNSALWTGPPRVDTSDTDPAAQLEWFRVELEKIKGKPKSLLNALRDALPDIKKLETRNALGLNLWAVATFAELIRHIIVHNSGRARDRVKFFDRVFQQAGLSQSGQDEFKSFMGSFFGVAEYENLVLLLDMPVGEFPGAERNGLDTLSRLLMAYAHVVSEAIHKAASSAALD